MNSARQTFLALGVLFSTGLSQCFWEVSRNPLIGSDIMDVYFPNPNIGFLVGYDCRVYKTTDAGQNWDTIFVADNVLNRVWFIDEQNGFVCGYYGLIYKTTDGGSNWTMLPTPYNEHLYGIAFWDSLRGIAAGGPLISGAILQTTDGGNTWSIVYNTDKYFTAVDVAPNGWAYASATSPGSNDCEVVRTTDHGQTWQVVYTNTDLSAHGIDCLDSVRIWVACWHPFNGSRVIRSINGGVSWEEYPYYTGWCIRGVKFYNQNLGFICGGDVSNAAFIMRSSDGGITWERLNPPTRNYLRAIAFPDSQRTYVVGFKATVLFSSDCGLSWEYQAGGSSNRFNAIDCYGDSCLLAVGDAGIIVRSTDAGSNWFHWENYPNNMRMTDIKDVSYINRNYALACGWLAGVGGLVLYTNDGGVSWEPWFFQPSPNDYWWSIHFADSLHGWIGGYDRILYTADGGVSWLQQFYTQDAQFMDMEFIDTRIGFAVSRFTYSGCPILRTTDGGANWEVLTPMTNQDFNDVSIIDENIAYFSPSSGSFLLKTTDGGDNWITLPVPDNTSIVDFASENQGWIAAHGLIQHTYDGGNTWHRDSAQENIQIDTYGEIFALDTSNVWLVANGGHIYHYTRQSSITDKEYKKTNVGNGLAILTNPAIRPVKIRYWTEQNVGDIRLKVYDAAGRVVKHFNLTSVVFWDGTDDAGRRMPAGIYFVQLETDGYKETEKLILLK